MLINILHTGIQCLVPLIGGGGTGIPSNLAAFTDWLLIGDRESGPPLLYHLGMLTHPITAVLQQVSIENLPCAPAEHGEQLWVRHGLCPHTTAPLLTEIENHTHLLDKQK